MKIYLTGIGFIVGITVMFYFTIIEKENTKKVYPYRMKMYYPRAEGIRDGTEVSVLGIPSGFVQSVRFVPLREVYDARFVPEGKEAVELTIVLKKPVTLWDNYKIKFKNKTVFSGRMIDIDPGSFRSENASFFHPTSEHSAQERDQAPSTEFYEDFFSGAFQTLEENRAELRRINSGLRDITSKINNGKGTVSSLINRDTLYDNMNESMTDLSVISREARWYMEMSRENDTVPFPFLSTVTLNLLSLNYLSQSTK
ncbi:MAG TPA: MlaD family protein [Leptospiraceae bacterium]|nr:MlaD family protein [Leptospiraceae bacterium]HMY66549.1 MlaD family protein [Leptospiraceae bacterium]HMZ60665.1 MlaD family protein [Leptospiraceae bacterium]HNF12966.1 MlaD family protein [Leptospiraceae bacterium]HNF26369.1 MlaD family protein [Leptospiraceae bacterium]